MSTRNPADRRTAGRAADLSRPPAGRQDAVGHPRAAGPEHGGDPRRSADPLAHRAADRIRGLLCRWRPRAHASRGCASSARSSAQCSSGSPVIRWFEDLSNAFPATEAPTAPSVRLWWKSRTRSRPPSSSRNWRTACYTDAHSTPVPARRKPSLCSILARERVHPLDVPFTQAVKVISKWGTGAGALARGVSLHS